MVVGHKILRLTKTKKRKLRILISGTIAGAPYQGGPTWAVLQYFLGFRQLGHEVYFLESIPLNDRSSLSLDDSCNALYFSKIVSDYDMSGSAALLDLATRQAVGMSYSKSLEIASGCDVLVNIAGTLPVEIVEKIPLRVYLDLDPLFTQLWSEAQGLDMKFEGHNRFLTVGLNVGLGSCSVPTCGLDWKPTLQPVVLATCERASAHLLDAYTTVANWRSYGSIQLGEVLFGQKVHSWRSLISIPRLTRQRLLVALSIHSDELRDRELLRSNGWQLVDPNDVTKTPEAYRDFIRQSKGELSIAKSGYVISRCGWFSERSALYLAYGRPVIAQSTEFERHLPTGLGLMSFTDTESAVWSLEAVERDYPEHSTEARKLAEEFFDSNRVLESLLRKVGAK
jgi:hypothetical protein